jgi:hypothetical protein
MNFTTHREIESELNKIELKLYKIHCIYLYINSNLLIILNYIYFILILNCYFIRPTFGTYVI